MDRAEQVAAVLALIEDGNSERSACDSAGINRATFRAWALKTGSGDHYVRALEALAADQVEKLECTIQDMRSGTIGADIGRIEVEARKWFASKFLPKRYGDRTEVAHSGSIASGTPSELTEEQLIARLSALEAGKKGSP